MTRLLARLKGWARAIERDLHALWLAVRDPRSPWYARALAMALAAYALSPIDLIPDVVPVLGYLDDAILLPLGILVVIRLIPPAVLEDCRARAAEVAHRPVGRAAAVVIVAVWLAVAVGLDWVAWPYLTA